MKVRIGVFAVIVAALLFVGSAFAMSMDEAAGYFADLLPELMTFFKGRLGMLNVNIPSMKAKDYRGVRVARTALQKYHLAFREEIDEDGRTMYTVRSEKLTECPEGCDTDEKMMRDGYVVITPLTYDITEYSSFDRAKALFERDYNA